MSLLSKLKGLFASRGDTTPRARAPDLEEVWRIREEDIYPDLFGGNSRGIFPLTFDLFANRFSRSDIDLRWLHYGVFEYGPTSARPFWLYVTSGHSNPWEVAPQAYDPAHPSGSGVEFLFATTEQADWAIRFLQNMLAFDILLEAGHFPGRDPLIPGDRIPLHEAINGADDCEIRYAVLTRGEGLPCAFQLPSGHVDLMTFVGVTGTERDFAAENGHNALVARLQTRDAFPVTDPHRVATA